jgi:hypothetical protein
MSVGAPWKPKDELKVVLAESAFATSIPKVTKVYGDFFSLLISALMAFFTTSGIFML